MSIYTTKFVKILLKSEESHLRRLRTERAKYLVNVY